MPTEYEFEVFLPCDSVTCSSIDLSGVILDDCGSPGVVQYGNDPSCCPAIGIPCEGACYFPNGAKENLIVADYSIPVPPPHWTWNGTQVGGTLELSNFSDGSTGYLCPVYQDQYSTRAFVAYTIVPSVNVTLRFAGATVAVSGVNFFSGPGFSQPSFSPTADITILWADGSNSSYPGTADGASHTFESLATYDPVLQELTQIAIIDGSEVERKTLPTVNAVMSCNNSYTSSVIEISGSAPLVATISQHEIGWNL